MATTNRDRVGRAMDILALGLAPFVERQMDARVGASWRKWIDHDRQRKFERNPDGSLRWDTQALLQTMVQNWRDVFEQTLGHPGRSLVGELIDVRNKWAHQEAFSYEDTHRALDSAQRLLNSVSAGGQAAEIDKMRQEVLRTMFAEQARQQTRRQSIEVEGTPQTGLKPWREVVTPHPDVASGRYVEAEFAADLAQVQRGDASKEYGDPVEFFRRTYLTDGLTRLLESALRRLAGQPGGDPVIELQTNFGGGKTHSMLALHHVCGHQDPKTLPGVDQIMAGVGLTSLPHVQRAVLVGTALSPSEVWTRGGVETRTLWGELAWQLLDADGYKLVEASDRNGVSPGSDLLHELLAAAAPCLILIDEWVAFVRQLYSASGLPAGSFDSNITFAQALTEAVKATPGALLVASLPASQIEIGGEGGGVALDRLKNTFGRVESSWRPASADEGFEIVRRRLFQPIAERRILRRARQRHQGVRHDVSRQRRLVPIRVQRGRLPAPDGGGISDPSRAVRPAEQRLGLARSLPAHPRRSAADGERDSLPLGARRQEPDDPAVERAARRRPGAVPRDAAARAEVGRDHQRRHRRRDLQAARDRPREPEPGTLLGDAPRGAHDLHGFGADLWGAESRDRRPPHPARLRAAGRDAGVVR